jgi:hypothetical protein
MQQSRAANHLSERRPLPKRIQERVAAALENRGLQAVCARLHVDARTLQRAASGERLNTRPRLMLVEAFTEGVI